MHGRQTAQGRVAKPSAQRRDILRGVYAQNRDLHSPTVTARGTPDTRRLRWWRPMALLAALGVVAAAAHVVEPAAGPSDALVASAVPATIGTAAPVATRAESPVAAGAETPGAGASPEATATPVRAPLAPPVRADAAAPVPTVADPAITLAEVAPLASDQHNLKSLFGLAVKTIVIDAGHGGHDPGALGKLGTREKDITLDVARRLKAKLEAVGGYRIQLVRDEDAFVALNRRAAYANELETDLFVSIHVNYLPSTSTNAVETYYFGHHQDARTRKLAERENQGSEYSLSEFESVMRNMQDTIKLQESKALARTIQESLLSSIRAQKQKVLDNGVRTAPFVVLLGVKAPSVLVEIGSLSSPEAEQNLRREAYRDEIASYVAAGITDYLNQQTPEEHRIHEAKNRLAERQ